MHIYTQYKNRLVRALIWILRSPSVISTSYPTTSKVEIIDKDWGEKVFERHQVWFQELDNNPSELEVWIDSFRSYRLGIRFEKLVVFLFQYLQSQGEIEQLKANLPIYDDKKVTMGEMDLLFYDAKLQQRVHWEVATKYYLFRPEEFNYQRWIGPNGGDWLHRKVEHLFTRQLGISNSIEAKIAIQQHFTDEQNKTELSKAAFVKGRLFYPLNHSLMLNDEEKELINKEVLTGWWCYPEFFYQADTNHIGKWMIIDKLSWIVPHFFSYNDEKLLTPKEVSIMIKNHFAQSKRSLHLAFFKLDESTQLWQEEGRGFVVDPMWPDYKPKKIT